MEPTKQQIVQAFSDLKTEIVQGAKFKGKAAIVRKINSNLQFLERYRVPDKNARLLYDEVLNELRSIKK